MEKVTKFVNSRPLHFILFTVLLAVVFGVIPITLWRNATDNITNDVALVNEDNWSSLVSHIHDICELTYPKINQSTIGLASVLDSYLTNNNFTYSTDIQTKIAPVLFQAYVTIPQVTQVSYISTNGLFFTYITESNTNLAVFANSSSDSSDGRNYTWYIQTVDKLTGQLEGNATKSQPLDLIHTDWFQAANVNHTTAFVGTGLLGGDNETIFQNVVSLSDKKGVVSLGFRVKTLTYVLNRLNLKGGELYLWTKEGNTVLVSEGSLNGSSFISNGSVCFGLESNLAQSQCIPGNCGPRGCRVEIEKSKFQAFSSVLEVSGVVLRYTLMFPINGGLSIKYSGMIMLIATMVLGVLYPVGIVLFLRQVANKLMHMRASLINQKEATQQAERKSMNKSQAFARASHDIRGSLAGITGLIDLCREEVRPDSELDTSLKQVIVCAKDLNELLNSVLDMSKIESGKMQLYEEEFNLTKLLEDVTDFFHPVAMKKGVDVVLDVQDGSIFKLSNLRGDSSKLKQILNNLVSNAVKFTEQGHISIRAWPQRPGSKSSAAVALDPNGVAKLSNCMFCKNKDPSSTNYETEISNSISNNANTMEIVFEVDDTGKGIPTEMRKSVFENYVQVRETAQGQQGTGLGLGIVQSLVRLMGGEIRIVDKATGEKGTCFQFSVLMKTSDATTTSDGKMAGQDIESGGDYVSTPNLGLTINTSAGSSMNLRNLSPRFNYCLSYSPKQAGSRVVLLLKDEERRRVTEKYIKSLGVKVTMVEKWEHLSQALESLAGFSPHGSMGRGESSLRNELSSTSSRELPLIGKDAIDSASQAPKKRSNSFYALILLVIDAKAGKFSELCDIVEKFQRGLQQNITCKVVWINDPSARGSRRGDLSFSKPLHGSRLNRVLKMLPEFGGTESKEEEDDNKRKGKSIMEPQTPLEMAKSVRTSRSPIEKTEEKQGSSEPKADELLKGKRALVVDDNNINRIVAKRILMKMGVAEIKLCNSGKEAIGLINEWFAKRDEISSSSHMLPPFDYIFMDCQMPEMDGYETTREIRKVERKYGVHIPIFALSAHDPGSREAEETIEAGMDAFLGKIINPEQLMNIISDIESKMSLN
ncbi:unnamed protein product [Cochlearia groenlandica]